MSQATQVWKFFLTLYEPEQFLFHYVYLFLLVLLCGPLTFRPKFSYAQTRSVQHRESQSVLGLGI